MKKFCRRIGNDILYVLVDECVFYRFGDIISEVLRTYTPVYNDINLSVENCFYIIPEKKKHDYPREQSYVICEGDENWLFGLINDLDVFSIETLKCTVIHGSCVRVRDKNILIIGERWSGKTTLTHFLVSYLEGKYISDDCVYLKNDRFWGFCMPLPMRDYYKMRDEVAYGDTVLTVVRDNDDVERTLLIPQEILSFVEKIDFILFPKYAPNSKGEIRSVSSVTLFKKLISNVRSYSSMREMYAAITNLLENAQAYSLEYSSSHMACDLMQRHAIV